MPLPCSAPAAARQPLAAALPPVLQDVLAGRKTGGTITGDIRLGGHPKEDRVLARVMG